MYTYHTYAFYGEVILHPPQVSRSRRGCHIYQGEVFKTCLTEPTLCKPEENAQHRKSMAAIIQNPSSMQVVSQPSPPPIQCVHGESPSRTNAHATSAILQCSGGHPGSDFAEGCWATDLPM